jgi:hypothetical protein
MALLALLNRKFDFCITADIIFRCLDLWSYFVVKRRFDGAEQLKSQ